MVDDELMVSLTPDLESQASTLVSRNPESSYE